MTGAPGAAPNYSAPPNPYPPSHRAATWLVVGLVVGALLGAGVVAVAGNLWLTGCSCPALVGLSVSFESTGVSHGPAGNVYAFRVTNVTNLALRYGDVEFQFTNATGLNVPPTAAWTFVLTGGGANVTAYYDPLADDWPEIAGSAIAAGQAWAITAPGASLDGGTISLVGTNNPFTGSCSIGIP